MYGHEKQAFVSAVPIGGEQMSVLSVVTIPFLLAGCLPQLTNQPEQTPSASAYWPSSLCRGCHERIFDQQSESMHAKSFTNPVFQAQYFDELLPQTFRDPVLLWEAEKCVACHSPIAFVANKGHIVLRAQLEPLMSGVTCDFCHTIPNYVGERPENGNYISEPGVRKLGPFKHETDWHHVYSEFITKSEFCAVCHNVVNHHGLEIKSTYSEWKASRYAEDGIQCQDCHMNVMGFLTAGQPFFESGKAADMTLGSAPYREKLYTHRFPGAHSRSQIIGALNLDIRTDKSIVSPGDETEIQVLVDNSRTGHSMPSGSADLRLMWLEVKAHYMQKTISISVTPDEQQDMRDATCNGLCDGTILKDDVPQGSRFYGAIFIDKYGRRTFSSYDAVEIAFDNRLDAAEIRKESFTFEIPEDAMGEMSLVAKLYYLSYPRYFAQSLGIPVREPVEIAVIEQQIMVRRKSTRMQIHDLVGEWRNPLLKRKEEKVIR